MDTSIGCSVIIHDNENRVLIAQRSAGKKCFPLMWELIGGSLEEGESPEQCIRREAMEEIGCGLTDLRLIDINIIHGETRYIGIVFTATIQQDVCCNEEIKQVKWVTKDEFGLYSFMTDGKDRLSKYFSIDAYRAGNSQ